jgi:hypothetical protein
MRDDLLWAIVCAILPCLAVAVAAVWQSGRSYMRLRQARAREAWEQFDREIAATRDAWWRLEQVRRWSYAATGLLLLMMGVVALWP